MQQTPTPADSCPNFLSAGRRLSFGRLYMALLCLSLTGPTIAQDIEPRRWTPLPVGTNVIGAAAIHTAGDVFFDPVLKVEDTTVEIESVILSFLHAFDLFGQSARFDVRLPHQRARWEGVLNGAPKSATRQGLGDPRLRLSVNFLGAPALTGKEYRSYRASHPINTVAGAALAVTLPLGEYEQDKLLNLGKNRFVIRPQIGVVHTRGPWSYELTGSILFFTDNNAFNRTQKLEQDPLFALQSHIIYKSTGGWWASVGAAYDRGGESKLDGVRKDDSKQDLLFGVSAGGHQPQIQHQDRLCGTPDRRAHRVGHR